MQVLVTGAAGLIGSNLCEALLERGDELVAIDNFNDFYDPARKRANVAGFRDHERCVFADADITDAKAMANLFESERPDAVAHLAAYGNVRYSIGRAPLYTDVNITGSVNVLEAARTNGCDRFVFASTSSAYGKTEQLPFIETDPCNEPLAPYPASKKAIEVMGHTYTNLHDMNFTAVRFFSVYGPRGRPDMMPLMVTDRVYREEEITLFDAGRMKRDWTYIDDIVSGVMGALDTPLGYEIINLGRGEPVLMSDFVTAIEGLV
ncbi:MAG: NAD-dependent epimerase/dehydratase family protein, partial [bacterium]|nr:NAD-dependent epimerase/dehydratase family protein [bacterium]